MIITCPNCQTKYQLAEKAISSAGRKVLCAHCRQSWLAHAEPEPEPAAERPRPKLVPDTVETKDDRLFDEEREAELDREFETIDASTNEKIATPIEPADAAAIEDDEVDPVKQQNMQKALQKRQARILGRLPFARLRRHFQLAGLVTLAAVIGGGIALRTEIVRQVPDLGGVYASVGLGVNVIGLEFSNAQTVRTLREGADVMLISAKIRNVTAHNANIPPVLVSIMDETGETLYQWSARPPIQFMGPGESVSFETQLTSAPASAARVQLVFAAAQTSSAAGGQSENSNYSAGN